MTRRRRELSCDLVGEKWLGRLDGTWAPGEEAEYRAHIAACASCGAAVAADEQVFAGLAREKAAFVVSPTSRRFLEHLATRAMAEARLAVEERPPRWRVAWRRLAFVGAAAVAGVFVVFAAVSLRQPGRVETAASENLEGIEGVLGELEPGDLPDVEALAAGPAGPGQAFDLSVAAMNRDELRLLDEELHLDLPADFAQIEAAMVAGAGGDGQVDEALDDLTDAELRDVGDQLGVKDVGPAPRERRGG